MDFKSLSMLSSKPEDKEEVLEGEHDLDFHNMLSFKEHSDKLFYPTLYNLSDNTAVEYKSDGFGELIPGGHIGGGTRGFAILLLYLLVIIWALVDSHLVDI